MRPSLNCTFHRVCTLVKHSLQACRIYTILQGCSVSCVLWLPLFPLHVFHFHPSIKPQQSLLFLTSCSPLPVPQHILSVSFGLPVVFSFWFWCCCALEAGTSRYVVTLHPVKHSWGVTSLSLTLSVAWEPPWKLTALRVALCTTCILICEATNLIINLVHECPACSRCLPPGEQ